MIFHVVFLIITIFNLWIFISFLIDLLKIHLKNTIWAPAGLPRKKETGECENNACTCMCIYITCVQIWESSSSDRRIMIWRQNSDCSKKDTTESLKCNDRLEQGSTWQPGDNSLSGEMARPCIKQMKNNSSKCCVHNWKI